jgi:hypothetical protein
MSKIVHELAVKAGIRYIEGMELCNGRSYMAYLEELTEFARLVGEIARKDEQKKLKKLAKP